MKREALFQKNTAHSQLGTIVKTIHLGRYFSKLNIHLLENMVKQGELISLKKDDFLIKEGDSAHMEMYILFKGSLAVMSQGKFILRLESPGDVVGEMGMIQPGPRSADVIAESDCQLVAFSSEIFAVENDAQHAPIFYVMFAHVLAEKLRITTAQSLIRKNERVKAGKAKVAIMDENWMDGLILKGIVETDWAEAEIVVYRKVQEFLDAPLAHRFNLFIIDVEFENNAPSRQEAITELLKNMKIHGAPIFAVSEYCNDPLNREWLVSKEVDEVMGKPFSAFEAKHSISQFKTWYYKHQELDQTEHEAGTDLLTGLANRRRLDEFLDALFALYPDNKRPFSLIISDVDHFKHYNDTQGHQMGDVVLKKIATIFAKNVRRGDLAARFGGEEFVMVLPNCSMDSAREVAEKLRKAVENEVFPHQQLQPNGNLTATFGVATYPGPESISALLKQADDCLYQGKEAGRNVIISAK